VKALRSRVARHGRSSEVGRCEILEDPLTNRVALDLKQHLLAIPNVGLDRDFRAKRGPARRISR